MVRLVEQAHRGRLPCGSRKHRAGAAPATSSSGVGQGAGLEAQAAAADAAVQPVAEPLDPLDLLVEARPPGLAEPGPVGLGRHPAVGQGGQRVADLLEAEPDPLRRADERDPAQRGLLVAALVARRTHRGDQPLRLVEPDRRRRHARPLGELADRQLGHVPSLPEPQPSFKFRCDSP